MNFLKRHFSARERRSSMLLAILFSFAVVVGGQVYRENSLAGLFSSPAHLAGQAALFALVALVGFAASLALVAAARALQAHDAKPAPAFFGKREGALAMWAAMFVCWIPCLLAYWPGLFSYDIPTQTNYIATGSWTTQQPPLHTLIWAAFMQLEGVLGLKAITWYCIAQMLLLSGSFAFALRFLAQRGLSRILFALACAFFALNPVIALFGIIPVKDTLLACALAFLVPLLIELVSDEDAFLASKTRCVGCASCILACCLLRSNMMVIMFVFAVIAWFILKSARAKATALLAIPLAVALVIVGPVYHMAHITAGSSAIASLPFQQSVNVVRNHADELPAEEIAAVDAVLPVDEAVEHYNPRFADSVVRLFKGKSSGAASLAQELVTLGKQWLAWSIRYPLDYLDSFLALNLPYWYPLAATPDPYSQRAYIETEIWRETPYYSVELDSKAPPLHDVYENVADFSAFSNPLGQIAFSPSSVIWMLALAFLLLYNSARRRYAIIALLPVLYWASFLIGPVSNMRYVFPLFCIAPLLLCAGLQAHKVFGVAAGAKPDKAPGQVSSDTATSAPGAKQGEEPEDAAPAPMMAAAEGARR